jgi:hypothetical protein
MADDGNNPYLSPEHASPQEKTKPLRIDISLTVSATVILGTILALIVVSRSGLMEVYADFDVELPSSTQVAMHLGMVVVMALALVGVIAAAVFIPSRRAVRICQYGLIAFGVVILFFYGISAFLPLVGIAQNLS